jgi:hypothetical protein
MILKMLYAGAKIILEQLKTGPPRRRVGFISTGPPIRGKAVINDVNGLYILSLCC